ncbi:dTMP kinase [Clostridiales Family XIII bacterium PM5-7]
MKSGVFITLEGPDGSGKSTQVRYLKEYLESQKVETVFTREPGGTDIGEKLRKIILDQKNSEMCDMSEALLYAASRAQHVEQLIRPALAEGKVVVCDRFIDSSIAYQGYGRQLGDSVRIINELAVAGCMPDLTLLMEISPEVGKSRIKVESQDRLEREKIDFHNRVFAGYEELLQVYPERFVGIDASRDKDAIRKDIVAQVDKLLKDRGLLCR